METTLSPFFRMYRIKTHPDEPDHAQTERRVEDDGKVKVLFTSQRLLVRIRVRCVGQPVDVLDRDGQNRIAEHPNRDQPCTERLVLIVHGGFFNDLLDDELRNGALNGLLELVIEVTLLPRCILDDGLVLILSLLRRDGRQCLSLVAAFGTP